MDGELQEVYENSSQALDDVLSSINARATSGGVKSAIRGTYYVNGEPVEGFYITDDAEYVVGKKKLVDMLFNLQKENERIRTVNSSLQTQIINNGKVLSDRYKASAKKEAIEKYGDEIISEYLESHKDELKIDKDSIIAEYLETHKKTFPYLQKANQERSEECLYRTALYLFDFCGGSTPKEISQKREVAYATVYRLLKINDSSDVDRLMGVYTLHKELFDGFTEQDVRNCLEGGLSKKTERLEKKLAAAREFIAKNTPNN
ncbi:MAG: hypothetical protein K2M91_04220 [Lachnospiraceae bacterium]|nr:hypothetical protein [Lachnospiraceae bacterium]